jgi:hypothetical protein
MHSDGTHSSPKKHSLLSPLQTFPQVPQLLLSENKSVQPLPQQAGVVPEVQAFPQVPQLLVSEVKSVQVPLHEVSGEEHVEPEPVPT